MQMLLRNSISLKNFAYPALLAKARN